MAILLILFMTCTSIASAQLIAMSSIILFDIYGGCIKYSANNKQLITAFNIGAIGSALFVFSFATGLHKGGVVVYPGMFRTIFTLFWRGHSHTAAIVPNRWHGMPLRCLIWHGARVPRRDHDFLHRSVTAVHVRLPHVLLRAPPAYNHHPICTPPSSSGRTSPSLSLSTQQATSSSMRPSISRRNAWRT